MTQQIKEFFSKYGVDVEEGFITKEHLGKTFLLYGVVTDIIEEHDDHIIAEINKQIKAKMFVKKENVDIIKRRMFEPGIFNSVVTSVDPEILVDVVTVVYGKPQHQEQ